MTHEGLPGDPGPTLARLDRPRIDGSVRLAVIADPHVAVSETGTWKVFHRTCERLRTALATAVARDADAIVLPGDLTRDGHRREFDAVDRLLDRLNRPIVAVPGNHDVPKAWDSHIGIGTAGFERRYTPGLPFSLDVGELTLLCVNTASAPDGRLSKTWGGRLSASDHAWLEDRLPAVETPVLVLHHNLAPLPENPGGKWRHFPLQNADTAREFLAEYDVPLAVTAHHHVPAVRDHGRTAEVLASATCSYPQASLLLDITEAGTTVRLLPLADREGVREARRLAYRGSPLGRGIAELVDARLFERRGGSQN